MSKFVLWLKGLLAAAISGSASSLAVIIADPDHFSPTSVGGFKKLGIVALSGMIVGAVMYLKQSPVPNGGKNGGNSSGTT